MWHIQSGQLYLNVRQFNLNDDEIVMSFVIKLWQAVLHRVPKCQFNLNGR